jgi:hypothetical protein
MLDSFVGAANLLGGVKGESVKESFKDRAYSEVIGVYNHFM